MLQLAVVSVWEQRMAVVTMAVQLAGLDPVGLLEVLLLDLDLVGQTVVPLLGLDPAGQMVVKSQVLLMVVPLVGKIGQIVFHKGSSGNNNPLEMELNTHEFPDYMDWYYT
ncbi:hypothetical protein ACFPA1_27115 [Neobacillus sp. GCM10023253]|uniref:hypothetical protein n=1 Tax=Neobacillus sp. GCM10023253 TaxID=3252644 RepID=UPI00361E38D7